MEHGFNMLENASDKSLERLSERRVLTEKEKERMLKMSMDKLNKMNDNTEDELQVSGVEQYNRPKWYGFATAAASLLLVGGIVGGGVYLSRNAQAPDDPMAEATSSTDTTYAEAIRTTDTTAAPTEAQTDSPTETAYNMADKVNALINLSRGWMCGEDTQLKKTVETADSTVEYYRCYDFDKPEDVKAKYREYFTEKFLGDYEYIWNESACEAPIFKDFGGKLYHRSDKEDVVLYSFTENDIEIESCDENRLEFTVIGRGMNDSLHMLYIVCVREDSDWKIDSYNDTEISAEFTHIAE